MTNTEVPAQEQWAREPLPGTLPGWVDRARQVRDIYSLNDASRDRERTPAHRQVELLKQAGLHRLLGPVEYGGAGAEWPWVHRIIREVASGDGSLGQLLGYHYLWYAWPRLTGSRGQAAGFEADATAGNWFLAGALDADDARVTVREDGDHLVFNGVKHCATGVRFSDVTMVGGLLHGRHVVGFVPTDQPGLLLHDDWDSMGQRLTASDTVTLQDLRVRADRTVTSLGNAYSTMTVPVRQLIFASIWLGIASQALRETAEYSHKHGRGWGGYEKLVDEPRVIDVVGDLTAKLWTAEALLDKVAEEGVPLHRDPSSVTARTRGEYKVRTAAVQARAQEVAVEVGSRLFEVTGARSTTSAFGFDRFWRNARTHTLHDPVSYQHEEIARYAILGDLPAPGWYS